MQALWGHTTLRAAQRVAMGGGWDEEKLWRRLRLLYINWSCLNGRFEPTSRTLQCRGPCSFISARHRPPSMPGDPGSWALGCRGLGPEVGDIWGYLQIGHFIHSPRRSSTYLAKLMRSLFHAAEAMYEDEQMARPARRYVTMSQRSIRRCELRLVIRFPIRRPSLHPFAAVRSLRSDGPSLPVCAAYHLPPSLSAETATYTVHSSSL